MYTRTNKHVCIHICIQRKTFSFCFECKNDDLRKWNRKKEKRLSYTWKRRKTLWKQNESGKMPRSVCFIRFRFTYLLDECSAAAAVAIIIVDDDDYMRMLCLQSVYMCFSFAHSSHFLSNTYTHTQFFPHSKAFHLIINIVEKYV